MNITEDHLNGLRAKVADKWPNASIEVLYKADCHSIALKAYDTHRKLRAAVAFTYTFHDFAEVYDYLIYSFNWIASRYPLLKEPMPNVVNKPASTPTTGPKRIYAQ